MEFLFTADLHLSVYSNDKINSNTGLTEKLTNIINSMNNLIEYGRKNKIKEIIIGGDSNHNKNIIHTLTQSILLDFVRQNNDMFFYFLDGNHDMSSKSKNSISSLKCLDNEKNVQTIHEPKFIDNILFVPWMPIGMSNYIKENSAEYLISHFGLNEAELSSGISIVSDLKLSDLKNYETVLLGHYHKPQQIKNVYYVGSLVQLDWGEKHEDKRFLHVNTITKEVKSIESSGYKKYFSFQINNENKEEIIEQGKQLQENGHNVVFEKVENIDTKSFENDFKFVDKYDVDITNRGISMSMSKSDIIEEYLNISEITDERKDLYKEIAFEIINDSSEEI